MGLLLLFLYALVIIVVVGTAAVVYQMLHPQRRSLGAALANRLATEPAELGLTGVEHMFTFRDGAASPGWVVDGQKADGPILVITHGWSNSRFGALQKIRLFAPFCSRIAVYDLRGHGDSTARISRLGASEPDDLLCVIDEVSRQGDRVVLFGSSMGAGITIVAAAKEQQRQDSRVIGVIVDGPYRYAMEPVACHLRLQGLPAEPFTFLAGWVLRLMLAGTTVGRYDRAGYAAQLRGPLLVIHGSQDPICPVSSARAIAAAAKDGAFVEFDDGGHGGLAVAFPQRYLDAVSEFFERVGPLPPK